jgi:hypothetical protein
MQRSELMRDPQGPRWRDWTGLHRAVLALLMTSALAAAGTGCGASPSCKDACDRISGCGLKSSGFSCDAKCAAPYDQCAVCINESSCAEIQSGRCSSTCPGTSFTK